MCIIVFFFFFKQKTAYEMRISDWSSDVCSSDLVKALMIEGGLPPTPVNYDLCYRYVAATDAGFVKAVDAARREGKFNGRTATRLRATFFGQTEEDVLAELMDETKDQQIGRAHV